MIPRKLLPCTLLLFALLSGCVGLNRDYPEISLYDLNPMRQETAQKSATAPILTLRSFTASPSCADANFLLRHDANRVEKDYYNRFVEAPAELLREEIASWLSSGSTFSEVRSFAGEEPGDWLLSVHLVRLEGDFSKSPATAEVAVQFFLRPDEGNDASRFSHTYEKRAALASDTPQKLVEAWDVALAEILHQLESDISAHFADSSSH